MHVDAAVSAMKGISIVAAGGPENLKYGDVDMPTLTEGQVLIEVYATALNGADLLQRAGNYPCPPGNVKELLMASRVRQTMCATGPGCYCCTVCKQLACHRQYTYPLPANAASS